MSSRRATLDQRLEAAQRLELRGWGKPKQDVVIDDHETPGFRIVYRQWPPGYDPAGRGERPKALPPLKGPTPNKDANGSH